MRRRWNRFLAGLLTAAMLVGLLPLPALAAGEGTPGAAVNVSTRTPEVPLLPYDHRNHSQLKEKYLYAGNALSGGKYFDRLRYNDKYMNKPVGSLDLAYNYEFTKKTDGKIGDKNHGWWASYSWEFSGKAPVFESLLNSNQLQAELAGELRYDTHKNIRHYWSRKETDMAELDMYMKQGSSYRATHRWENVSEDGDGIYTYYGKDQWASVPTGSYLLVEMDHTNCRCGSSAVKGPTLAFMDARYPTLTGVTTTANQPYYRTGSFDITLTFDENIRFADPNGTKTATDQNRLKLAAYKRGSKQSVDNVYAYLVSVKDNQLIYRYTVPSTELDIVITGVASSQPFNWSNVPLALWTNNGKWEILENLKTSSEFTDLAGNPVSQNWARGAKGFGKEIRVDNKRPSFVGTKITQGSMLAPASSTPPDTSIPGWAEDIDRSRVSAGVDDWIEFAADFDEEMNINASNVGSVTATLNLTNGVGGPAVTLRGEKTSNVLTSVNDNIPGTRVIFGRLTITDDMVCTEGNAPIRITNISLPSGTTDLCDNGIPLNIDVSSHPDKQEYLDVTPPLIAVTQEPTQDAEGLISLGFEIADGVSDSPSGTIGVGDGDQATESGKFILTDPTNPDGTGTYQYNVTYSSDAPSSWRTGTAGVEQSFVQSQGTAYLWIKPDPDDGVGFSGLSLTIRGYDYAGNPSEAASPNMTGLSFPEEIAPTTDAAMSQDSTDLSGSFIVRDTNLERVEYALVHEAITDDDVYPNPPDEPAANEWQTVSVNPGEREVTVDLADAIRDVYDPTDPASHFFYLFVRAEDKWGNTTGNEADNETTDMYTFNFDLRLPSFYLNVPVGISQETISVGQLDIGAGDQTYTEILHIEDDQRPQAQTAGEEFPAEEETAPAGEEPPVVETYASTDSEFQTYGSLFLFLESPDIENSKVMLCLDDVYQNESGAPARKWPNCDTIWGGNNTLIPDLLEDINLGDKDADNVYHIAGTANAAPRGAMGVAEWPWEETDAHPVMKAGESYVIRPRSAPEVRALAQEYKNLYGEVTLYALVMGSKKISMNTVKNTSPIDGMTTITNTDPRTLPVAKFTFKSAKVTDDDPVNSVTFGTPRLPDGRELAYYVDEPGDTIGSLATLDSKYTGNSFNAQFDGITPSLPTTLAGLQIPFTLKNERIEEWGVEDIDFDNSYVSIHGDNSWDSGPLYTQYLTPGTANQTLIFPNGVDDERCSVKVTLKAKGSDRVDVYEMEAPSSASPGNMNKLHFKAMDSVDYDAALTSVSTTVNDAEVTLAETSEPGGAIESILIGENATPKLVFKPWDDSLEHVEIENFYYSLRYWYADTPENVHTATFEDGYGTNYGGNVYLAELSGAELRSGTLCYQLVVASGIAAPVRQVEIRTVTEGPVVELAAVPSAPTRDPVTLNAAGTYSPNGEIVAMELWTQTIGEHMVAMDENGFLCDVPAAPDDPLTPLELTENDTVTFRVTDQAGVTTAVVLPVNNIDKYAPDLSAEAQKWAFEDTEIEIVANDSGAFDEVYPVLYITDQDPDAAPPADGTELPAANTLVIPFDKGKAMEEQFGSEPNALGIFSFLCNTPTLSEAFLTIETAGPANRTLYVYAVDPSGNRSEVKTLTDVGYTLTPSTDDPGLYELDPYAVAWNNGRVELNFDQAVRLDEPASLTAPGKFAEVHEVAIYNPGEYEITGITPRGEPWKSTITVKNDQNFPLQVSITPAERTNSDVTAMFSSSDQLSNMVITGYSVDGSYEEVSYPESGKSLELRMTTNGTITLDLKNGSRTETRTYVVDQIDRSAAATIVWSYDQEFDPTSGLIVTTAATATVVPEDDMDELVGLNGPLSYTATSGEKGSVVHTFTFQDQAGNENTLPAILEENVTGPVALPTLGCDVKTLYTLNGSSIEYNNLFLDATPAEAVKIDQPSMVDRVILTPNMAAEVLLLPAGTTAIDASTVSAAIEGVTRNGNAITVEQNASFVIGLRAGNGQTLLFPVDVTEVRRLDTSSINVAYENVNSYTKRAYFHPGGQTGLVLTNPVGPGGVQQQTDPNSSYNGLWYHEFNGNGSYIFYYKDDVGNSGSITATVSGLVTGDIMPVDPAKPVRWWPYEYQKSEGENQSGSTLSTEPVNYDVTAQGRFNMNVRADATYLQKTNGDTVDPAALGITLLISMDTVKVTYSRNTAEDLRLVVVGENDPYSLRPYTMDLKAVTIIDKIPANVTVTGNTVVNQQSATLTFTPTESVACAEKPAKDRYTPAAPMVVTVTENGSYTYHFTDLAGNETAVTVEVTGIDNTAPTLRFSLTGGGTSYSSWKELAAANNVATLETVYVQSSESGKLSFQEIRQEVAANAWTELPIVRNGNYMLVVTDLAGNMADVSLSGIQIPDSTPPVLRIAPARITVRKGIPAAELDELLRRGVAASDNQTPSEQITITYAVDGGVDLATAAPGEYRVIYTATDLEGNESRSERTVALVEADALALTVNGLVSGYAETLPLGTGKLQFTVTLPVAGEAYTIYVKKGYKTIGQMKNNSTKVENGEITLTGTGFYTVYLVTQTRKQYITYLYIEQ